MRNRQRETERRRDEEAEGQRYGETNFLSVPLSLCLSVFSLFIPLIANAQTGEITGRVVTEDGVGMPNVTVLLNPAAMDPRPTTGVSHIQTATDEDGNFKFTGLAPRVYSVVAAPTKGYVHRRVPFSERQDGGYHRVGANVTITMVKGGAITGRVTNAMGEPLVRVQVNPMMTRDAEGNPVGGGGGRSRFTDDRGVYRVYGLQPGTYVVFTRNTFSGPSPYDLDTPTFHPSSTRETATEVTVISGGEVSGVDIRYRGDTGHVISGTVTGGGGSTSLYDSVSVSLTNATFGAFSGATNIVRRDDGTAGFAIHGVPDGAYEITARSGGSEQGRRCDSEPSPHG